MGLQEPHQRLSKNFQQHVEKKWDGLDQPVIDTANQRMAQETASLHRAD